jgi:hypothetical protein
MGDMDDFPYFYGIYSTPGVLTEAEEWARSNKVSNSIVNFEIFYPGREERGFGKGNHLEGFLDSSRWVAMAAAPIIAASFPCWARTTRV